MPKPFQISIGRELAKASASSICAAAIRTHSRAVGWSRNDLQIHTFIVVCVAISAALPDSSSIPLLIREMTAPCGSNTRDSVKEVPLEGVRAQNETSPTVLGFGGVSKQNKEASELWAVANAHKDRQVFQLQKGRAVLSHITACMIASAANWLLKASPIRN